MNDEELIILYLHGWQSVPGGVKPSYLRAQGATVIEPALPADDFDAALAIAEAARRDNPPDLIVGSSRGGALAMNMESGDLPLVLLAPAWKRWGSVDRVKPGTRVLHAEADDVIAFADSLELVANSGLDSDALIRTGSEHRLADPVSLERLRQAVQAAVHGV
jgi:hypothetical protein